MIDQLTDAQSSLELALPEVKQLLRDFLLDPQFNNQISLAFSLSSPQQSDRAREIISQWVAGEVILLGIELVSSSSINGALGAYAAETNTIYLSQEFLSQNQNNPDAVRNVLLEELGHAFSHQLNPEDAPGDEGNLFANLVLGNNLSDRQLESIQTEDDTTTVILDDAIVEIEQAEPGGNTAFDLIGLTALRNDPNFADIDGTSFDVVIIDSGLDRTHPLLDDNYRLGLDFIDGDDNPNDLRGHGTHVSGTIGAEDENIGVAPDVGLIGLKIGDEERPNPDAVIEALKWVLDEAENDNSEHNIVAVNLSLGGGFFTSPDEPNSQLENDRRDLIRALEAEGIVVVSSAGNSYIGATDNEGNLTDSGGNLLNPNQEPNLGSPAIYSTIAVGAVWHSGRDISRSDDNINIQIPTEDSIAVFSQRLNANNFLFAPGVEIESTYPQERRVLRNGTSQAAPHVAGSVVLLQEIAAEYDYRLSPEEIRFYLINNADIIQDGDDEEDIVISTDTAYPRINIHRSAIALREDLENAFGSSVPENTVEDLNGTIRNAIRGPIIRDFPSFDFPEINFPEIPGRPSFEFPEIDFPDIDFPNIPERPSFPSFGFEPTTLEESIGFDDGENLVGNTDVDFYRFTVTSSSNISFLLNPLSDGFVGNLRLFDLLGNEIALNGNGNRATANLDFGIYFLGVSGDGNADYNPNVAGSGTAANSTGDYSLTFDLSNVNDPNGVIDGAIDVSLGNSRQPSVFDDVLGTDFGEEVISADVDLYRLTVPDNGELRIDIDTPFRTNFPDSYLRLFNENGEELVFSSNNQLVASDNDLAPGEVEARLESTGETVILDREGITNISDGVRDENGYQPGNYGHSTDSYLSFRAERGTTYYIGVSDANNQQYDPTTLNNRGTSNGSGGQYELTATFINDDLDGTIDSVTEITSLPTTGLRGNVGIDGDSEVGNKDVDFYRINSPTAGILEIDLDSVSAEATIDDPVDTVIVLFDADGNQIGLNDNISDTDSRLRVQIAADTDYYAGVTGAGNQDFDPFALGSGSAGDTGEYIFNSRLLSLDAATNISNNTIESELVRDVTLGERISGRIGEDAGYIIGATDVDIYRFVATRDGTINIRVEANLEFSADTFLRVFDANGNEIAFNDDENSLTRGSFVELNVRAGTEYYIGINGFSEEARNYDPRTGQNRSAGSRGTYNLSITEIEGLTQEPIGLPNEPNDPVSNLSVYRFFNNNTGVHFYTANELERNAVQELDNFSFEGASYISVDPLSGQPEPVPVYRFLNQDTGVHLYTISEIERDAVRELNNFSFEGEAFFAYESEVDGSIPIYRFFNSTTGAHFYTPSVAERNNIEDNLTEFQFEGIAYYALPLSE